ncbi:hypothetical protein ACSAWM_08290, partial [Neisseria gonorrhoeae]|uniref:hypothetical protein n=1 Tax=Neisseria gonorrhoeae TaxID=485 RepID=UPI003EBAD9B5
VYRRGAGAVKYPNRHSRQYRNLETRHSRAGGNLDLSVQELIGQNGFLRFSVLDSHFRGNDGSASVGRILVSDKTFNIPIIAIHCSNVQNVEFKNPAYKIIPSIIL